MTRATALLALLFTVACEGTREPELLVLPEFVVLPNVGDTVRMDVVFTGTNVSGPSAALRRFSSGDATIARVDARGLVFGVARGETFIRVTAVDRTVTVPVRVE